MFYIIRSLKFTQTFRYSPSGWSWDFSWYGDYSEFPSGAFPFFIRGNAYDRHTNAGVYSFAGTQSAGDYSFRPVLVIF